MLSGSPILERVAHRGSPRERLENTLPGFLLALEHGADGIELDVHVTRDGEVVVHHDFDVAGRAVSGLSGEEVRAVTLADGARVPLLSDVLRAIADRAVVYVELKGHRIERQVAEVLQTHGCRYAMHSFDHEMIARVRRLHPGMPRGILVDRGTAGVLEKLPRVVEQTRPRDVWPHYTLVDDRFMAAAAALDLRVIPWTVNSPEAARRLKTLGVAGICTDDVRLLANL